MVYVYLRGFSVFKIGYGYSDVYFISRVILRFTRGTFKALLQRQHEEVVICNDCQIWLKINFIIFVD